jgi:hypothetical protein
VKFLLPTGIGDSVWALHKIQAIRDAQEPGGSIDVHLACGSHNAIESRALDFVRRFTFVDSAQMFVCGGLGNLPPTRPDGTYNYISDGWYDYDGGRYCVLIPNATLERGERLESWLPHYPIRWDIFDDFRILAPERRVADRLASTVGPYAVFYPGPLLGNTTNGHNRGGLWRPTDWLRLGQRIRDEFGLHIVVVGAAYDAAYYDEFLAPMLNGLASNWTNLIGGTSLGELWSITSRARFVISYQAGVGIISTYLGTPTGIFWRADGDSISPDMYLTFREAMASAWVPPSILSSGSHLPLIYGRDSVDSVLAEIRTRRWACPASHVTPAMPVTPSRP